LHFGRLAAFVRAASGVSDDDVEAMLERQALAVERHKPELVAAWPATPASPAAAAAPGHAAAFGEAST
jgi:hypothetical protein